MDQDIREKTIKRSFAPMPKIVQQLMQQPIQQQLQKKRDRGRPLGSKNKSSETSLKKQKKQVDTKSITSIYNNDELRIIFSNNNLNEIIDKGNSNIGYEQFTMKNKLNLNQIFKCLKDNNCIDDNDCEYWDEEELEYLLFEDEYENKSLELLINKKLEY